MEWFYAVLIPAAVMLGIALLFGAALMIISSKLSVDRDKKIDEIEYYLSKSNCGGCGRGGCAEFAEALIRGEAELSGCNATSAANKIEIAKILGVSGDTFEKTVSVVRCNGGESCFNKFDYQGYEDCISAASIAEGNKACDNGCLGFGSCKAVCSPGAVKLDKERGFPDILASKCNSCGACIRVCPKNIIGKIPKNAAVYIACSCINKGKEVKDACSKGCIACGLCVKHCPEHAITMGENNIPAIDYSKCGKCLICVAKCPAKVIKSRV